MIKVITVKAHFFFLMVIFSSQWALSCPSSTPPQAHPAAHYSDKVEVVSLLKSSETWAGKALPPYLTGQPEIHVLKITIPGNMRLPLHFHPMINTAIVVQGHLRVTTEDGQSKEFKAGEAFNESVNRNHFGESIGDEPVILYVVYANVRDGQPLTVLVDQPKP